MFPSSSVGFASSNPLDSYQLERVRVALRQHPVVGLIGGRGTGKTVVARQLESELAAVGVRVVTASASGIERPEEMNAVLAEALRCTPTNLVPSLADGEVVRVLFDQCDELYDKPWLPQLQETWRGVLQDPAVRGRLGLLLLGRPLFRAVAGGKGSPLLNMGVVMSVRPLTEADTSDALGVAAELARALVRKTGGHPYLTSALNEAIGGRLDLLGTVADEFAAGQQRYLMRLAEDHGLAGMGILSSLLDVGAPVAEQSLIHVHFGDSYSAGLECVDDLAGSGLVRRTGDDTCEVGAQLLSQVAPLRQFLRASADAPIPIEFPDMHTAAAAVLYRVENELRDRVRTWLSEVDRTWWPTRIPDKPAGEAESRWRAERDSRMPPGSSLHPMMYLNFGELIEILIEKRNWDEVFCLHLNVSKAALQELAGDVLAVRNKVAHNRPVSESDLAILTAATRSLGIEIT